MSTEGINQTSSNDKTESLRLILERLYATDITIEEAQEVGESLLQFFEVLADNSYVEEQRIASEMKITL